MEYRKADRADIEALTEMRLKYIRADMGVSIEDEVSLKEKIPLYFELHLDRDIFAFVAKDEGIMVATALLLIIEKPSNPHFINGKVGNVLSVYTLEGYRHQGISTRLMQEIILFSKEKNLDFIELSATAQGYPLYKKLGFEEYHTLYVPMRFNL
ncbi:MAG: GNAT family N-acetyltransferase [Roseburia sp.]|nr:GNAT family N-acetyltransferase [Roseburia sp.]